MDAKKKLFVVRPHDGRMDGKVYTYSNAVNSGMILAENKFYLFYRKDWLSDLSPAAEQPVKFSAERNWARAISVMDTILR